MKRFLQTVLALMVAAVGLSACTSASVQPSVSSGTNAASTSVAPSVEATIQPSTQATNPPSEPATPEVEGALLITDSFGREVSITIRPARIVSLAPSITEILFAIGAGERVVGNTTFCNYPPEAAELPKIGGYTPDLINFEAIVDLQPDLVIVGEFEQEPAIATLEQLGIPVVGVVATTIDEVYTSIEQIGAITGYGQESAAVVKDMRDRIDAISSKVASMAADQRPRVFWEVFDEPLITTGPSSFISQLIERAGGVNIFADQSEAYPQVSHESVIALNPEVILGTLDQVEPLAPERVAQRPGWSTISAVEHGRIYLLDSDPVSRAGPRLADALEAMLAVLHPELVP
jgi:iron complex transport system substrate-binding protein